MASKLHAACELIGHKDRVTSLDIIEGESGTTILASSSRDKKVFFWSIDASTSEGKIIKEYSKNCHNINDIAVTKSSKFVVTAGSDKLGKIININTNECIFLRGHQSDVLCAAVNCTENKIVTGSADKSINLWTTEGVLSKSFNQMIENAHSDWITCVEFRPSAEDIIISGSMDGCIKIWDISSKVVMFTFFDGMLVQSNGEAKEPVNVSNDGSYAIKALSLTADGSLCAYGGYNCKVYVLNLNDNDMVAHFETQSPITSLSFCPIDSILACGTRTKIYLWDLTTGSLVCGLDLADYMEGVVCTSLVWSANVLFAGFSDGKIRPYKFIRK